MLEISRHVPYLEANSVNINKAKRTITTSPASVGYVPWVIISRYASNKFQQAYKLLGVAIMI